MSTSSDIVRHGRGRWKGRIAEELIILTDKTLGIQ